MRVQIDKYWILILIQENESPRRYEWEIEDYKDLPTKILGVGNNREAFRGYIECGSIIYSDHYNDSPQSSHHVKTPHGHTGKKEDSKIYIEKLLAPH